MMPQGMCQPVSLRHVQQDCGDFGGHRSNPRGWGHSAGELLQKQAPTGVVWANTLVDVPAALGECWGHGLDSRAGTPPQGRPTPTLAGDRPKYLRAPPQELTLCQVPLAVILKLGRCSRVLLSLGGRSWCVWASVGFVFGDRACLHR